MQSGVPAWAIGILFPLLNIHSALGGDLLSVHADFEGGSVRVLEIDQQARSIRFMPGGDPERGWPCWWYFRIDGMTPGETLRLQLQGSNATLPKPDGQVSKPLSPAWAMPKQATFSTDGAHWGHTAEGTRTDAEMVYQLQVPADSVFVAWGPPYTPKTATAFVRTMGESSPLADAQELCRSREGRSVPMLHVSEGNLPAEKRFGVWIQARQHAWESGSSWVAQGVGEWLLSENDDAAWLRQHAEIFLIPIMDVDNTATGNGGKDALPHDHNRDWSAEPHWNEVVAAQRKVNDLIAAGRMDLFVDLHNPAASDSTFFYILPADVLQEPKIGLRNRFIELALDRIRSSKPPIPVRDQPKPTGPKYHPLWRQISADWVSMHGNPQTVGVCLETGWNHENSTTDGYRAVGAGLAAAIHDFLAERSRSTGKD
jgi:hypothetical protein